MTYLLRFLIITCILANMSACKNDTQVREEATAAVQEEIKALEAPLTPDLGKLAITTGDKLTLDNNTVIELPAPGDKTFVTLFIIRNAENTEGKTSLSNTGLNRAGYLASLLGNVNLSQVYVDGNGGLQTGLFAAQANKAEVNTIPPGEKPEVFLKTLLDDFKGKRLLIVGSKQSVPAMINALSGKIVEGKMPENEFDHFFVAKVKSFGDAEIAHLRY